MQQNIILNSSVILSTLTVVIGGLSIVLLLPYASVSGDPWDVQFSKKWGSTCLLATNIGCIDTAAPSQTEPEKNGDGKFWGTWGIASDESAIYTLDVLNNRVQKSDLEGGFIKSWGKEGTGNGDFTKPSGIAVDSKYVYVVDYGNRVQVFDKEGQFINALGLGSGGTSPGPLKNPEDVDVDSAGRIYVADSGNHRIQIFYPNNMGGIAWGKEGTGEGQFNYPQGISVPSPGHVYVADSHNNRIQYFQLASACPSGTTEIKPPGGVCFVKEWGEEGTGDSQFKRPADITVSDGFVYVVDGDNNRIQLFDKDGVFIQKFGSECLIKTGLEPSEGCKDPDEDGPLEIGDGQFKYPAGITVRSNTAFVADNFNDRVQVFDVVPGQTFFVPGPAPGQGQETFNIPAQKPPEEGTLENPQQLNKLPVANAGSDKSSLESQSVGLNGGGSSDSDGTIESYKWEVSGCSNNEPKGTLKNSDKVVATFEAPEISGSSATCRVVLEVTDDKGSTDTDQVEIKVTSLSDAALKFGKLP